MTNITKTQNFKIHKPNLLFIWTDEQRADTLKVYGNLSIKTPNLSKLAEESVVFQNAYVTQPVCTPSRASVMTGLWPHQCGCTQNNIALPLQTPTFPELLNDSEYIAGYFGKWHLGDEIFPQHNFQDWCSIEDMYNRYYREDKDTQHRSSYHHWLEELGYQPDTPTGEFSRKFAAKLPLEHCKPQFLAEKTCEFLRKHHKEPFVLFVNFLEPHMPFTGPLNNYHSLDEVSLPNNFDDPIDEHEPQYYQQLAKKFQGMYAEEFDLSSQKGWKRLIANYWGLVSQVDISVGKILNELARLDLDKNTIVVFTSDHGDMMGSHRLVEKCVMYQEAIKVPLMIRLPQKVRYHKIIKEHVSHIDLVPTLLELMGKEINSMLPGKSLLPTIFENKSIERPVIIEWNAPEKMLEGRNPEGKLRDKNVRDGPDARAIITQDGWKLCLFVTDTHQLFQLNNDPGERHNLFYNSNLKDTIRKLSNELYFWQDKMNDGVKLPIF